MKIINATPSPLFKILEARVEKYFEEKGISEKGNWKLYSKTIFWFTLLVTLYVILVFFTPTSKLFSILLCVLLGFNWSSIGFNVMHDAGHESYSKKKWVNKLMLKSLTLLGASELLWIKKHNVIHHNKVNTTEDDDVNLWPIFRIHKTDKHYFWHYLQAIYALPFYSFLYLLWITVLDTIKFIRGKIGNSKVTFKLNQKLFFVYTKVIYWIIWLFIPMIFVGVWPAIIGWATAAGICGLRISVVFQLAHTVENTQFPIPDSETGKIPDRANHQLATTSNFARKSWLVSWLVGGLNFQVEHHLFPKISHVHYPALSKIVKDTCDEFGVQYREYKTSFGAFWSHIKFLWKMSRKPKMNV